MTPFAVYADDYNYIPIGDLELYNAYRYFNLYGFNLDYTNTISYTQNSTGNISYEGTLNSDITGSENGSIGITLNGTLSSANGEGGTFSNFNQVYDLDDLKMTILASRDGNIETISYGCVFSNPNTSVGAYSNATCTPTDNLAGFDAPDYDITIEPNSNGTFEVASTGQLFITLVERTSGQGSYSGFINLNQSGTQSGTGSINLSGTTSTTGHKIYDIPLLTTSSINNDYITLKRIPSSQTYVISYLTTKGLNGTFLEVYKSDGTLNENAVVNRIGNYYTHAGYFLMCFEIDVNDPSVPNYIKFNTALNNIIPLYVGRKNHMSDELYRYIYGTDRTDELLENGNTDSQNQILVNNRTTDNINYATNDLHDIENQWENNLDNKLSDINTTSDMLSNNKFLATSNWVRTQFERIVLNTPFELLLVFSLILGLALVLIGKVR